MGNLSLFSLSVVLFGIAGCTFIDDRINKDPCSSQYDRDGFIAVVEEQTSLGSFSVYPKNFRSKTALDPDTVDCGVILASLGFSKAPPVQSDSFAVALAKTFFSLPANGEVERLELELENILAGQGRIMAHYAFTPRQIDPIRPATTRSLVTDPGAYSVVVEAPFTINTGQNIERGLRIEVLVDAEPQEPLAMANSIKQKYQERVRTERIDLLTIDMKIERPSCQLCTFQAFEFFFTKMNGTQ